MRELAGYRRRAWRRGAPKRERARARRAVKRSLGLRSRLLIGAIASGAWYVGEDAVARRRADGDGEAYGRALLTKERLMAAMGASRVRVEAQAPAPLPPPRRVAGKKRPGRKAK